MKTILPVCALICLTLLPSCRKRDFVYSEYGAGFHSGKSEVDSNIRKDGWWGEIKMDVKDELNYVPHDSNRSIEFNAGKVDGYLNRRGEISNAERETHSKEMRSSLWSK